MSRNLVTSSRYSPGNMTPAARQKLFVGREKLVRDILKRIAASAQGDDKHYQLLVGQRGVGKTHLIWLLRDRMDLPEFAAPRQNLRIAILNEEEWGVASYLDLLVRILQSLATPGSPLAARVEGVFTLHERDPDAARREAEAALIDHVGEMTLLLMCENLVDLFAGLGDEGQKRWRAFIQEHPFWTIVATTPAMFTGVQLQTSPFYGFFNIRNLERLDLDTAVTLLRARAELDGKQDLVDFLDTPKGRARVRAIHLLAGGFHRVYVVLSDFLTKDSLDELYTPFLRMVDDLTPYYQDRMRQLSPQQRKIVECLCRERVPMQVKRVAARCMTSQQTAAKQLGDLAKTGFVRQTRLGRETFCELAEPLMRICIEVKDNRTDVLRIFVDLLRGWYSARESLKELHDGAAGLSQRPRAVVAATQGFAAGMAELVALDEKRDDDFVTLLEIDAALRGPGAMARNLVQASAGPEAEGLARALLPLLGRPVLQRCSEQAEEWQAALRILESAPVGNASWRLVVRLFAAGTRFRLGEGDAALLGLALEERELVSQALALPTATG